MRPGLYFWWLQLQRCGGLTGVCVVAVSQPGARLMKQPSFVSIQIQSRRAEVCGVMNCGCGKCEEDDNEKWKALRKI